MQYFVNCSVWTFVKMNDMHVSCVLSHIDIHVYVHYTYPAVSTHSPRLPEIEIRVIAEVDSLHRDYSLTFHIRICCADDGDRYFCMNINRQSRTLCVQFYSDYVQMMMVEISKISIQRFTSVGHSSNRIR